MVPITTAFGDWLRRQPRGTKARIARETGISPPTIDRARDGLPVISEYAEAIAAQTNGGVDARDIAKVPVGKSRFAKSDESRRVA
jgi:hypothetical protein